MDFLYSLQNGLIYSHQRLYVSNNRDLHLEILSDNHNSRVAGHYGQFKTTEIINANFYWPNMDQNVMEYMHSCDNYRRNEISKQKEYGTLQPLEVPYRSWTNISMNFIVRLPESSGFTRKWVIVDHFSKTAC